MSASLAVQRMIRLRLSTDGNVRRFVPPANIADRHGRPVAFPSIILGDAREYAVGLGFSGTRVAVDLHVWTKESGTASAKAIVQAVRCALRNFPWESDDISIQEFRYTGSNFMPDTSGRDAMHAVVSFSASCVEFEEAC